MKKNSTRIILAGVVIIVLCFWKCPFERLTGIPCPGCMMTTAAYYLIQLDFQKAFYFNPVIYLLLFMALPLFIAYKRNKKWFHRLLLMTLIIWLCIYAYRMITIFPEFPMSYVEDNVISNIIKWIK